MTARIRATILGCGSSAGVPRIGGDWGECDPAEPKNRRRRCSLLLERTTGGGTTRVLVDTPPDMRTQLLDAGVGLLDGVLYTHPHADHLHGLDDLRSITQNRRSRLPVWADAATSEVLLARFSYAFVQPEGSFYPPILDLKALDGPVAVDGAGGTVTLEPFPVEHGRIEALGFRIGRLAYLPDVSAIPDTTWPVLQGLDVLILDALRRAPHPTHTHLAQSLAWIERAAPRLGVLTNMHNDLDYATLAAELPPNVVPAYDGLALELAGVILDILLVVLPVFLVIGAGYAATRAGLFSSSAVDGLMVFTQSFAVPCLLFRGLVDLDFGAYFDARLLVSFYLGAVVAFALGILGARRLFHRRPGEAVAIGFGALFSNSVLLGLPIMEHAYGRAALAPNFAIISIHAPFCYLLGTTAMEFARADGRGLADTGRAVAKSMFRNALMIALALGFAVNLLNIPLPRPVRGGVDMMADAALPAALFGLGGVFTRYAIRASLAEAGMIAALSLLVHPAIAYALSQWTFHLPVGFVRSAVMTAAMAPGVNSYVFASLYGRGQAQAASTVLLATGLSVLTISAWLAVLGGVQ